ncbi:MAG: DHH family phosphoesterase [Phycisphaerales bacterium]|nr:DHH family phosphoesterase [Phycisphaerales bacterium]
MTTGSFKYETNTSVSEIATRLKNAKRVLITTHTKPDGDAMGCSVAMKRALEQLGITADLWLAGPVERGIHALSSGTPYHLIEEELPTEEYDVIVVVDTGAWTQLEPIRPWLEPQIQRVICIDHHRRGDEISAMRLIDPTAAACSEVLVRVLDAMGCKLTGGDAGIAEALFAGLATDTGWFKFSSAGASTFALASRLMETGIDKPRLFRMLEENSRPQRLALEARALSSVRYGFEGKIAVMVLRPEDFEETGAETTDLTGMVNAPMVVGRVSVSIILTEAVPGKTKISFRSKPPAGAEQEMWFVDVNSLAARFGGGGHRHAAGCQINDSIDASIGQLMEVLEISEFQKNPERASVLPGEKSQKS